MTEQLQAAAENTPLPGKTTKGKTPKVSPQDVYNTDLDTGSQPFSKKRVTIILEDNPEIPPTGQFLSVNGRAYVLRSGEKADVPEELLSVLNDAVMSVPVVVDDKVVGYRDRMRFPYRVLARDVN